MKDYKRLTDRVTAEMLRNTEGESWDSDNIEAQCYIRLAEIEDKIESGEIDYVAEWKRRAEVAEQKATEWKDCANKWQKYYKEQAERDIAEEKQISIDECLERLNEK